MRCPSCRAQVGEQDQFCRGCGVRLANAPLRATDAALTEPPLVPMGRGRRLAMVALYLALALASAVVVYLVLDAGQQRRSVTLGTPRLVPAGGTAGARPAKRAPPPAGRQVPRARRRAHEPAGATAARPRAVTPATSGPEQASDRTAAPRPPSPVPGAGSATATARDAGPARREAAGATAGTSGAAKQPDASVEAAIERFRAGLDADSVRMVVAHHLPQVRACYDRALKQQSDLAGIVEIRFSISGQGRITSSSVQRNTTGHSGLGQCLAVIIRRWRFPRPVGGEAEFIYPFVFSHSE